MSNIFKRKFLLLVCMTIFAFSLYLLSPLGSNLEANAAGSWTYINDLSGTYYITSSSNKFSGKCIDIYDGKTSSSDNNAPKLLVYNVGNPVQANQRFVFSLLETKGDQAIYYITSSLDKNGRFDVKNGNFSDNTPIWFYGNFGEGSSKNSAQRWSVRTNDSGKTIQIVSADYPTFVVGINSVGDLVITSKSSSSETKWNLNTICGTLGVNTKTYMMEDNIGYNYSSKNEKSRYLDPINSHGYISNLINVGVYAEGIRKQSYKGTQAFSIPYTSRFYVDTSFVYSNKIYSEWTQNLELGRMNSGGGYLSWHLSNDSWEFTTVKNNTKNVGIGLYAIETSEDNVQWNMHQIMPFNAENRIKERWEIDGELIKKGIYIRISYMFEIYAHWTEHVGWWIFGHDEDRYEHKNIREVSDSFFVCVDGYGEKDLGVVTIKNKSINNGNLLSSDGYSIEDTKFAETLTDGSMTLTGFKIESPYPSYRLQVSKNNGAYYEVTNGYQTEISGKYKIKVTSKFNETKEITVYVCKKNDLTSTYFGTAFASKPSDFSFIRGTRILSGKNKYLDNLGIVLNYSSAEVPVYKTGCTYNLKNVSLAPVLKGSIKYEGVNKSGTINIDSENNLSGKLNVAGYYSAVLNTTNKVGDVITFKFNWWVVEESPGPMLNKTLLTLKSQETYDLIPVYYSVMTEEGPYTYEENGETIQKRGVLYYAFANYESALSFALRVEKQYALKDSSGNYYYSKYNSAQTKLNEIELFRLMYENAKKNVTKSYFSTSTPTTMRILKLKDEKGNDLKYEDGRLHIAYYIANNTNGCIVTTDKSELAALTARQPYINNFEFISIPLDSYSVNLTDENGKVYQIEYDKSVEEQLAQKNAPSGKYIVKESTIFGDTNKYEVYYIAKNTKNDTIVNLEIDGQEYQITNKDNGKVISATTYFAIQSAKNVNDIHSLIVVTKNIVQDAYDINEISNIFDALYKESGEYNIKVEDRMGNNYTITIRIGGE